MTPRLIAGCMTGTSIDGLDAALIRTTGTGLGMNVDFVRGVSVKLEELAGRLRAFASGERFSAGEITLLARQFGELHATALRELLGEAKPDLIVLHGQTVFHKPPLSWQFINPWPVAAAFKTPVVFDLRGADLIMGGQGAPITPIADFVLFRSEAERRAVVNLGGFINTTLLPAGQQIPGAEEEHLTAWVEQVSGGDLCACNQILDEIARVCFNMPYDKDGEAALKGVVDQAAFESLLKRLQGSGEAGRSLGTGDELHDWVSEQAVRVKPETLARSAAAAIAERLARSLTNEGVKRVIIAGGGVKNQALRMEIEQRCNAMVVASDSLGVPAENREAMAMGIIGALMQDGYEITLKGITGRQGVLAGGVWTGTL